MSLKSTLFVLLLAGNASALHASEAITPEGLEYCTVCHGSQLKGNANIQAPRLGGLSKWYIERQLNNFKQGIRGAHTGDVTGSEMQAMTRHLTPSDISAIEGIRGNDQKDTYGQQMKAAVSMVQSDPDAVNLAAYISQLK